MSDVQVIPHTAFFEEFPKIARLNRDCVITEKIDGTNGLVAIDEDLEPVGHVRAGSRSRWITPEQDNHGFAKWVEAHADELRLLGPGKHYGEWWGSGIQRGYGLPKGEKRFSLFNVGRWNESNIPACCHVVPVLYRGPFNTTTVAQVIENLQVCGSKASPDFMRPEGIIVYHEHARTLFKVTVMNDALPKSLAK